MTAPTDTAARPVPPLQRFVQIETDCFCDCGYNLHGQTVTRDERLSFMVCQCPECGRFHPAGHATAASSQWLGRLAAGMLIVWSLVVLGAVVLLMFISGALQSGTVDGTTYFGQFTTDDRPIAQVRQPNGHYEPTYLDTHTPAPAAAMMNLKSRRVLTPPKDDYFLMNPMLQSKQQYLLKIVIAFTALLGWVTGALAVIFLWHWRKRNYVWVMLVVLLPAAIVVTMMAMVDEYESILAWAYSRVAMIAALQCAFVMLGIWTGRPVGRFIAKVIIPPRPRQFLSFLWLADGKTPPAVKVAGA